MKWLDIGSAAELAAAGTDAYRIASSPFARVERFGDGAIISRTANAISEKELLQGLESWSEKARVHISRIYVRELVSSPGRDDAPRLLRGPDHPLAVARENKLGYGIDFLAGYSCGLFPDQRANREILHSLGARRVLNTFAYTCAFSVAAAAGGAETLSLDLAKSSLARGRRNFEINDLPLAGHRFIADDVFDVLPRLARRGEKFDVLVLDPPTFSRGQKGRIFRVEKDYGRLVEMAAACASPGAWMLLSTNCSSLNEVSLRKVARASFPREVQFTNTPSQLDVPAGQGSVTIWAQLP